MHGSHDAAASAVSAWCRRAPCARPQVDQLKEEIGVKDLALVKEHFDHIKVGPGGLGGCGCGQGPGLERGSFGQPGDNLPGLT